jgi:hypothetical protein
MSGNNLRMNPLAVRKRLLLAESELNRAQLARDVNVLTTGVRALTERTKAIRSVASSAAGLVAGLAAFQRARRVNAGGTQSRLQAVLQCAGLVSSLWLAYRVRRRS